MHHELEGHLKAHARGLMHAAKDVLTAMHALGQLDDVATEGLVAAGAGWYRYMS